MCDIAHPEDSVPKLTEEQRAVIVADVEQHLFNGRWSRFVQLDMAEKHGVTTRTLRKYRAKLERQARKAAEVGTPEEERQTWLARLRQIRELAVADGKWGAAASMMATEARVLGIESPHRLHLSGGIDVTARPERQLSTDEIRARLEELRREKESNVIELREVSAGRHEPAGSQ